MSIKRTAFFISDRTGITVEKLGRSMLSQFDGVQFNQVTLPFIDSVEKAHEALKTINEAAQHDGQRPIVFSTLIVPEIHDIIELFTRCWTLSRNECALQRAHGCGELCAEP